MTAAAMTYHEGVGSSVGQSTKENQGLRELHDDECLELVELFGPL